jgi:hypothetical protein
VKTNPNPTLHQKAHPGKGRDAQMEQDKELEQQLHSELELPGRTEVTHRETGAVDHAKSRIANLCTSARLSEVRMVQHVKGLEAKFMREALGNFGPLDE